MDTRAKTSLRGLVLSLDAGLIVVSTVVAVALHSLLRDALPFVRPIPNPHIALRLGVLVIPLWLVLISLFGLDRTYERAWTRWELAFGLAKLQFVGFLALTSILFFTQIVINRSLIAAFLLSSLMLLYVERSILGRWQRFQAARGQVPNRLLLVGDPTHDLLRFVRVAAAQSLPPHIVGVLGPGQDALPQFPRRLGGVDDLAFVLRDEPVDAVVFFPPYQSPTRAEEQLAVCEALGVPAHFAIDLAGANQAEPRVMSLYDLPFVTYEVRPKSPARLALKHGSDVVLAGAAIVVLSPILLLAAAAILATMGRPIFYAQDRAGLRGRRFRMYKFRTMVREAEAQRATLVGLNEMSGPVFKLANDPRVTPLGRFLRRTSIDELPQLFNVLTGSMSLVGPRPLPVEEQQQIEGWHRRRLMMKPGLTCLWQIGGRNQIDFQDWMKSDLRYIDQWNLGLDLKIIMKTIPAVIRGRGAH